MVVLDVCLTISLLESMFLRVKSTCAMVPLSKNLALCLGFRFAVCLDIHEHPLQQQQYSREEDKLSPAWLSSLT